MVIELPTQTGTLIPIDLDDLHTFSKGGVNDVDTYWVILRLVTWSDCWVLTQKGQEIFDRHFKKN